MLNTITVLNHLAKMGCKVSPHKAQICKQEVAYLGYLLKQGTRNLMAGRKQAIATQTPREPKAASWVLRDYRVLLNLDPNFGLIAKPLYNSLKRLDSVPFKWTK